MASSTGTLFHAELTRLLQLGERDPAGTPTLESKISHESITARVAHRSGALTTVSDAQVRAITGDRPFRVLIDPESPRSVTGLSEAIPALTSSRNSLHRGRPARRRSCIDTPTTVNADGTFTPTLQLTSGTGLGTFVQLRPTRRARQHPRRPGPRPGLRDRQGIVNLRTRLNRSNNLVPTLSLYEFLAFVPLKPVAGMPMRKRKSSENGAPSRS